MTDDRIRDIYKDDDPKELERLYCKVDAEVEKSKGRRVILLFVGFFLAYFLFFCIVFKPDSFDAIASFLLVDLFASPLHTWIHLLVFQWFIHKQQQENDRRELVLKRIQFAKERESRNTPYYQGWSAGYDIGYDKGYDKGYKEGRDKGHDFHYREGHCEGYDQGYRKGYHDARIDLDNGVYEDDYDDDDDE